MHNIQREINTDMYEKYSIYAFIILEVVILYNFKKILDLHKKGNKRESFLMIWVHQQQN